MNGLELAKEIADTAFSLGMMMYSDELCCQGLAWLLVYGGAYSAVTLNPSLALLFTYAGNRLNLKPNKIPNAELLPLLQKYIREAENHEKKPQQWIEDFEKRYRVKSLR